MKFEFHTPTVSWSTAPAGEKKKSCRYNSWSRLTIVISSLVNSQVTCQVTVTANTQQTKWSQSAGFFLNPLFLHCHKCGSFIHASAHFFKLQTRSKTIPLLQYSIFSRGIVRFLFAPCPPRYLSNLWYAHNICSTALSAKLNSYDGGLGAGGGATTKKNEHASEKKSCKIHFYFRIMLRWMLCHARIVWSVKRIMQRLCSCWLRNYTPWNRFFCQLCSVGSPEACEQIFHHIIWSIHGWNVPYSFFPPPKIYLRVVDTPLRNLCNFFFLTFVKNSPSCMTDGLKCSSLAQQVTAVIHSCWKGNHFNRFVLLKWLPVSASVQPNAPPPPTPRTLPLQSYCVLRRPKMLFILKFDSACRIRE